MWYLIVPPIIVVASLAFLLWYLSRKSADPIVAERVSHLEEEAVQFSRTKTFFLKALEKTMQRSKVVSLRMHNVLNDRLQAVRHRRQEIAESVAAKQAEEEAPEEAPVAEQGPAIDPVRRVSGEDILAAPIVRQRRAADEGHVFHAERPMVSETAAEPEGMKKRRIVRGDTREADLIGRIAADPKDFSAYEALGDYYLEIGNIKDAKECYRQVLRLSPTHRMVKIKIRRLEKLLTQKAE